VEAKQLFSFLPTIGTQNSVVDRQCKSGMMQADRKHRPTETAAWHGSQATMAGRLSELNDYQTPWLWLFTVENRSSLVITRYAQ
jgi:hypothetical protein